MQSTAPRRDATLRSVAPRFVVADMARAFAFYAQLGFRPTYHQGQFAIIERDGIALHVNCFPEGPQCHAVCWIGVENIEVLYRQSLPTHAIAAPLATKPYGFKEFCVRDPFGNLLLFAERVATADGRA
jgi:hypothetical protein